MTLGGSPDKIGDYAFYGCKKLYEVNIPDGVKLIGDYAFAECPWIRAVRLPESIEELENSVFYGCERLESFYIPKDIEYIGISVFGGNMPRLTQITYGGTADEWRRIKKGEDFDGDKFKVICLE